MADDRSNKRVYLQPAFLICVAVLTVAAGASIKLRVIEKEFLPLKKSFDLLNEEKLATYKIIKKLKIENQDILDALGTQDYIQCILEDTQAAPESAVQKFMLFITYYGRADKVPHVPEECYTGGGYQILSEEGVTFNIKNSDFEKKIDGKYVVFGRIKQDFGESHWGHPTVESSGFPVLYFFKVNGEYAVSRGQTRIALNKNLFNKFSYFSKVELVFNQTLVAPGKEESVAAGEKLLAVLLPILEEEHWPDWKKTK
jgi:hypothetical protein